MRSCAASSSAARVFESSAPILRVDGAVTTGLLKRGCGIVPPHC